MFQMERGLKINLSISCFILFCSFFPFSALTQSSYVDSSKGRSLDPVIDSLWLDSLKYFVSESDHESVNRLVDRVVMLPHQNADLFDRISEYYLLRKDRAGLLLFFEKLDIGQECAARDTGDSCRYIRDRWLSNLDSRLFYEDSAPKFYKANLLLESRECAQAHSLAKELLLREGSSLSVEQLFFDIYVCMNDTVQAGLHSARVQKIKMLGTQRK
jgi:hypothetical protein